MVDFDRLVTVLREAGDIACKGWAEAGGTLKVWNKTADQLVCESDLVVDLFLKSELGKLLPAAAWLSEETADTDIRLDKDLLWLVDPIDGTRDFVRGRTGWAISVALVSNGRPLIGILNAPSCGQFWLARAGKGARLNGKRAHASQRSEFSGSRVPADQLPLEDQDLQTVYKPNSIALRMAMVASDDADLMATVRLGNEWDIGAAALIAREAGAAVTDALGAPLIYNKRDPRSLGVVCCAPAIHDDAIERLASRAAKTMAASNK